MPVRGCGALCSFNLAALTGSIEEDVRVELIRRRAITRESEDTFLAQHLVVYEEVAGALAARTPAVAFSSSGAIAAISAWLIGLPAEAFIALDRVTVNTGISKVVIGRQGMTLVSFNEHSHLEGSNRGLITYG